MTAERELTVEQKLKLLCKLQFLHSKNDKIRTLQGELPLEVRDLEAEVEGLKKRIENYSVDLETNQREISNARIKIEEAEGMVKKYTEQQNNVRNNREFDSLNKEIEYQELEIQLANKHLKEHQESIAAIEIYIQEAKSLAGEREEILKKKKKELDGIIAENQAEEKKNEEEVAKVEKKVDERLLKAYNRIRNNAVNGLAVVGLDRGACGGCFNRIPPQRQVDVAQHQKVIVCEYCGRILVEVKMIK